MVKKTGILERLRERFTGSGPVRVKAGEAETSRKPAAPSPQPTTASNRVVERSEVAAAARPIAASSRKMSRQEESQVVVQQGLADLATLLRGVQERLEGPATQIARLPELAEAQLTALRAVAERLDRQEVSQTRVAEHLEGLPDTLHGVQQALERVAATDTRTAATLSEFKRDMGQIQSAMGELVDAGRQQASATASAVRSGDEREAAVVRANRETLDELKRVQSSQAARLGTLAEQNKVAQLATMWLLAGVLAVLCLVAWLLAFR